MFQENVKFYGIDCYDVTRDFTSKQWSKIGEAAGLFLNAQKCILNDIAGRWNCQSNLYYGYENKYKGNEATPGRCMLSYTWDYDERV